MPGKILEQHSTCTIDSHDYKTELTSCRALPVAAEWPLHLSADTPMGTACVRSCCSSFSDRDRPVPSYLGKDVIVTTNIILTV